MSVIITKDPVYLDKFQRMLELAYKWNVNTQNFYTRQAGPALKLEALQSTEFIIDMVTLAEIVLDILRLQPSPNLGKVALHVPYRWRKARTYFNGLMVTKLALVGVAEIVVEEANDFDYFTSDNFLFDGSYLVQRIINMDREHRASNVGDLKCT